jgi:hypothetical protein
VYIRLQSAQPSGGKSKRAPLPALAAASRLEDANDGQPVGHA